MAAQKQNFETIKTLYGRILSLKGRLVHTISSHAALCIQLVYPPCVVTNLSERQLMHE